MVEILRIEKIISGTKVSDFVNITFRTDLGGVYVTRYPIQNVDNMDALKQFVYEKAEFLDARDSFTSKTDPIDIKKDEWVKPAPPETSEQKFLRESATLIKWKEYYDIGLITEAQYTAKVNQVKLLIPSGYFDTPVTKDK